MWNLLLFLLACLACVPAILTDDPAVKDFGWFVLGFDIGFSLAFGIIRVLAEMSDED